MPSSNTPTPLDVIAKRRAWDRAVAIGGDRLGGAALRRAEPPGESKLPGRPQAVSYFASM